MIKKHVLLWVLISLAFAGVSAHAQSAYGCYESKRYWEAKNPTWHCSCACDNCQISCTQGSSGSSSNSSNSSSTNAVVMQQVLTPVFQNFFNWLLNGDPQAEAKRKQMMEELEQRKAEAERQHKYEEAKRLDAMFSRLSAKLKLDGLPKVRMKFGDNDSDHVGIPRLPGIALNDNTGNGGTTPYGIPGLPGIYTNGPGSGSGTLTSQSRIKMKFGDEDDSPKPVNLNPSGPAGGGNAASSGAIDPGNLTPQQLADLATQVSNLPPEEQQRLMDAAQPSPKGDRAVTSSNPSTQPASNTSSQAALSQLQQQVGTSQSAANATNLEDAAAKARLGFDQPNGTLPKPEVTLAGPSAPVTRPPKSQPATTQKTLATSSVRASGNSSGPEDRPMVVSLIPPPPGPSNPRTSTGLVSNKANGDVQCPPGTKPVLSRRQLQKELAERHVQLEGLKTSLLRLNRTIQLDQKQFAVWENESNSAIERLNGRIWDLSTKLMFDKFIDLQKAPLEGKRAAGLMTDQDWEKLRKLDFVKNLKDVDDFRKWALEHKEDRAMIEDGIRQIVDFMPLDKIDEDFASYLHVGEALVDNAYDYVDLVSTWNRVQQLDHNSTAFLDAVGRSGERMKKIVGRIKDIETELNSKPVESSNASPCRAVPASAKRSSDVW